MSLLFRTARDAPVLDIRLLRYQERAVLRILDRAEAATPRQIAILVYGHRRIAQRRLAALWQAGLLERAVLPPAKQGGAEIAYRLSRRARDRLGDKSPRARGSNRLGHTLDVVETVCSLVTAYGDPRVRSPVQAWLTETTARGYIGVPPDPDSVVVLADGERSGVLCLEVDEATQRRRVIEAKLHGYRRLIDTYPDWQVLFIVPSRVRARWLRMVASSADQTVTARSWVTSLAALRSAHVSANAVALDTSRRGPTIRELLVRTHPAHSRTPVGSEAWLRLLGEGGVEELDYLLF